MVLEVALGVKQCHYHGVFQMKKLCWDSNKRELVMLVSNLG